MAGTKPITAAALLLLAGCSQGADPAPGDVPQFDGIGENETIKALGNEPFWSAKVAGSTMTYSTPENIEGTIIEVSRFAGNGGLGFSGTLDGAPLLMAVTPGECSDHMSDRSYPYTVTITIDETQLNGCAYTDQQPFTGEGAP